MDRGYLDFTVITTDDSPFLKILQQTLTNSIEEN